jgi:hypothetical protein
MIAHYRLLAGEEVLFKSLHISIKTALMLSSFAVNATNAFAGAAAASFDHPEGARVQITP